MAAEILVPAIQVTLLSSCMSCRPLIRGTAVTADIRVSQAGHVTSRPLPDMCDELRRLRDKQAESRLQERHELLAAKISSDKAKPWNKNTFLNNVRVANEID